MLNTKMFVVIEGLSGSGKSTIAQILSKTLGGISLKPPSEPFDTIRQSVDETCDTQTRFLFYLTGISHISSQIKELKKTNSVILDKYIDTTILYPKSKGYDFEIPKNISLETPDYIFYLDITEKNRLERLKKRDGVLVINPEILIRARKIQRLFITKKDIIVIDNNKTTDDTINQIMNILTIREKLI